MSDYVTVRLKKETCEMLKKIGAKGETYDDVVRKLIESYKSERGTK